MGQDTQKPFFKYKVLHKRETFVDNTLFKKNLYAVVRAVLERDNRVDSSQSIKIDYSINTPGTVANYSWGVGTEVSFSFCCFFFFFLLVVK